MIEVNPRSSRTVPYISKVNLNLLALQVLVHKDGMVLRNPIDDFHKHFNLLVGGGNLRELGYEPGLQPEADYFAIKMPVFSFEKIRGAEISLGPESILCPKIKSITVGDSCEILLTLRAFTPASFNAAAVLLVAYIVSTWLRFHNDKT